MKNKILILSIVIIVGIAIWFAFYRAPKIVVPEPEDILAQITYNNASNNLITVGSPLPNTNVGQSFPITGEARGTWFFEASFPIELRDNNNNLLTTIVAQAQGEWMTENFVPFSANIVVPNAYTGPATLVLKKDNPSGEPAYDASISFPVVVN